MIRTQEKDGWAQEPVGLLWGTEKSLAPVRNHPAHSLTTTPSSLPKCACAPARTNTHTHTHTHTHTKSTVQFEKTRKCVSNLGENMMQFLTWITITPLCCIHTLPHDSTLAFPRAWQRTTPVIHALVITGNPPGIGMETSLISWKVHQIHMCNGNHKMYRTQLFLIYIPILCVNCWEWCFGKITHTRENRRTQSHTSPSVILSTTNLTLTGLGLNLGLQDDRSGTNYPSDGMTFDTLFTAHT